VVRAAQAILVIISPEARTSRHVRETLEMARMYRRPVCGVWIEGEHWQECLPQGSAEVFVRIDARRRNDPTLFEELATLLEQGSLAAQYISLKDLLRENRSERIKQLDKIQKALLRLKGFGGGTSRPRRVYACCRLA
jgi:RNase P/RNase MRP subunit p30